MAYFNNFIAGILLGISSGIFCAGSCAPIFLPVLFSEHKKNIKDTLNTIVEFNLGRLAAYIIWGAIAGGIGVTLKEGFAAWSLIITSVLLIIFGLTKNFPRLDLCKKAMKFTAFKKMHILLGFLIGLNVCPPFLVAFSFALDLNSILRGVLFFTAFFSGTLLWYVPLLFSGLLTRSERVKGAAQIACLITGAWFLLWGITQLN